MGVTIHYVGRLHSTSCLENVVDRAEELASNLHWGFERIGSIAGPYPAGYIAYPDEDCEPLRFEFDPSLKARDWVKTHFAGPDIHVQVVGFLRQLRPLLRRLGVRDEGEYWETGSEQKLREHMDSTNHVMQAMKSEKPTARIKVREPDGRITDMIG
jgi:hypothetical protein